VIDLLNLNKRTTVQIGFREYPSPCAICGKAEEGRLERWGPLLLVDGESVCEVCAHDRDADVTSTYQEILRWGERIMERNYLQGVRAAVRAVNEQLRGTVKQVEFLEPDEIASVAGLSAATVRACRRTNGDFAAIGPDAAPADDIPF
jgi:hypothetical protein